MLVTSVIYTCILKKLKNIARWVNNLTFAEGECSCSTIMKFNILSSRALLILTTKKPNYLNTAKQLHGYVLKIYVSI